MDRHCLAHSDRECDRVLPHEEVDASFFSEYLQARDYLHLLGTCGEGLPSCDSFKALLFWEQMKLLFNTYPVAGREHRNFMTYWTVYQSISEKSLMDYMPEMYRGIFPIRNIPDGPEDKVDMEDVAETPEPMTPFKHGTNAPARRRRSEPFFEAMADFGHDVTNRALFNAERCVFSGELVGDHSPLLRPLARTNAEDERDAEDESGVESPVIFNRRAKISALARFLAFGGDETDEECTDSCSESCAGVGSGEGAGAGAGAGSRGFGSNPDSAFDRFVMGTPPRPAGMKRKGNGKGKGKGKRRAVLETPDHKLRRREKIARLRREGLTIPTPAEVASPPYVPSSPAWYLALKEEKRKTKRRTEVENLKRAEAFMPRGPEVLPKSRTGTSENPIPIYTEPTEEELIAELAAYEEGGELYCSEALDGEGSEHGAEWLLSFDEAMGHLDEIRMAMAQDMTMLQKRALQREEASLMRFLRKIAK